MALSSALKAALPRYRCHKIVGAAQIADVSSGDDGSRLLWLSYGPGQGTVQALFTAEELREKPEPRKGMYLVSYEDGYVSFSPADTFENGYKLDDDRSAANIN